MLVLVGQVLAKKISCFFVNAKGSAVRIAIGRSFHELGTVQEKVCELFGTSLGWLHKASFHLQNASFWRAHKFALASLIQYNIYKLSSDELYLSHTQLYRV